MSYSRIKGKQFRKSELWETKIIQLPSLLSPSRGGKSYIVPIKTQFAKAQGDQRDKNTSLNKLREMP